MKKILLFLFLAVTSVTGFSQTPLTEAVDFDITFTDGTTFNLFDKLDEGKYVVIDWFFTTCGPCIANQPSYTETFQNFGCNNGEIFFLSVETTVDDAATIAYEEDVAGENAPPAASGTEGGGIDAAGLYSIGAYPTFILIAPDGEILEQDMWPLTDGADTFTGYFESHGLDLDPCVVSVDEESTDASLAIYPNPAQDFVNIDLNDFSGNVDVQIYNVVGELVYNENSNNTSLKIDLSDWVSGNYMLNISDSSQSVQKQFTVIK